PALHPRRARRAGGADRRRSRPPARATRSAPSLRRDRCPDPRCRGRKGARTMTSPAIALVLACTALARPAWGQDASALDLIKRVREAAPKGPFTAKGTLSSDRGWTREFELSHKWTDGVSATYLEVTAPGDLKGTRFLVFDRDTGRDEQHIYVPAAKRSIQ